MAFTEDLERKVGVLADATANNTRKLEVNRADLEKLIQQLDHRLMALEVSVKGRFEQVDRRFEGMGKNLGGLSVEIARVAAEVSRLSTLLGVQPPPPG